MVVHAGVWDDEGLHSKGATRQARGGGAPVPREQKGARVQRRVEARGVDMHLVVALSRCRWPSGQGHGQQGCWEAWAIGSWCAAMDGGGRYFLAALRERKPAATREDGAMPWGQGFWRPGRAG